MDGLSNWLPWRPGGYSLGTAAIAVCIILFGVATSFYAASSLEQREFDDWTDRARSDAYRLTEFATLALNQGEVSVSVMSERVHGTVSPLTEEALSAVIRKSLRHTDSVRFDSVIYAVRHHDAGALPSEQFIVTAASGTDVPLQTGMALSEIPAVHQAASSAFRLVGRVVLGSPFESADGWPTLTLAARTDVNGKEGVLIAVFDLLTFFESFLTSVAPDGLVLRLGVKIAGRDGEEPLIGHGLPLPNAVQTFEVPIAYGETVWRYSWDMLPGYEGGRDESLGTIVRYGGAGLFVVVGLLIALLLQVNRRITLAVRSRTEELARARDQAEIANRTKSEFLANMSHELRTPLNSVIGFAEILESQVMGPESWQQYREYAADIRQSGRHLLSLINDILDLSKAEAGHLELDESYIEPEAAIEGAVRLVHERARNNGLEIETEIENGIALVRCDERRVKQILLNLLSNAIKFTPRGGMVTVRADTTAEGGVRFQVCDTGIGMRPSDIPLAMTKFQQLDNAPQEELPGTGLGLPLADNLARLHDAKLEISSELGRGTVVSLIFGPDRVGHADDVLGRAG
ncbi:MAG: ATP-binding protein [Alphaproteobacteria bacterium]|nr:ATP-binding protein [Alphaproteobacteria bacterium]